MVRTRVYKQGKCLGDVIWSGARDEIPVKVEKLMLTSWFSFDVPLNDEGEGV